MHNSYKVHKISDVESTNDYMRDFVRKERVAEGTAIMAGFQQSGRGQVGNTWVSNRDENILISIHLKPDFVEVDSIFTLNMIVSLAVVQFLNRYNLKASIKWPNDIIVERKKIAGILIENTLIGRGINDSIVGIGLNVKQKDFPEFNQKATSMTIEKPDMTFDIDDLVGTLLECLFEIYFHQKNKVDLHSLSELYHQNLLGLNRYLLFEADGREFQGCIKGVDRNGMLRVKTSNSDDLSFAFKEIKFLEF